MVQFLLIIGAVGILISGISIGAWTDGERERGNIYSKIDKQKNTRTKISLYFGIGGIVSLIAAGIWYFFKTI